MPATGKKTSSRLNAINRNEMRDRNRRMRFAIRFTSRLVAPAARRLDRRGLGGEYQTCQRAAGGPASEPLALRRSRHPPVAHAVHRLDRRERRIGFLELP